MSYKVFVDDNFHYMDEDERYFLGEFDTAEAAVAACQKVVNEWLEEHYKPGMTAAELSTQYAFFGEDPFIMGGGSGEVLFSAHQYASDQIEKMAEGSK
jgi:hypothetical protein